MWTSSEGWIGIIFVTFLDSSIYCYCGCISFIHPTFHPSAIHSSTSLTAASTDQYEKRYFNRYVALKWSQSILNLIIDHQVDNPQRIPSIFHCSINKQKKMTKFLNPVKKKNGGHIRKDPIRIRMSTESRNIFQSMAALGWLKYTEDKLRITRHLRGLLTVPNGDNGYSIQL